MPDPTPELVCALRIAAAWDAPTLPPLNRATLAALAGLGLVTVWESDGEALVTLSEDALALAADAPPTRAAGAFADAGALEAVADPAPGPAEVAARRDEAESKARKQLALPWRRQVKPPALPRHVLTDGLPWPLVFLGLGTAARPWRELAPGRPASDCESCRGRELAPLEYCDECDRWGLMPGRPAAPAKGEAAAPRKAPDPKREKELRRLERERLKAARKAKRQEKRKRRAG